MLAEHAELVLGSTGEFLELLRQALVHVDEPCSRRCASGSASRSSCRGTARSASDEWSIATYNAARTHDVTLFILDPSQRLALIRKPHFAADVWRPPGGGIKPGEDFVAGAVREALEETGLHVELRRYLVASRAVFRNARPRARRGGRTSSSRRRRTTSSRRTTPPRSRRRAGGRSPSSAGRLRADAPRNRARVLALPRGPARRGSARHGPRRDGSPCNGDTPAKRLRADFVTPCARARPCRTRRSPSSSGPSPRCRSASR